ncbi:MAG TPA: PqqD family protein [Chloroflexota bacterium]|nr:PqqD family protein [Chloroflexota bacterium]
MRNLAASNAISEYTRVVATSDQVSCDLEGETIILGLKDGVYYGLNPVGTRVWQLVQEPRTIAEIRATLLTEYDVDPDRCLDELLALVLDLAENGLAEFPDVAAP